MCGIAGILNYTRSSESSENLVLRMITQIHHRGPDESGMFVDDNVCLGHARLSILGLQNGTQPIGNHDESLWIVYNGEVFNYLELQKDLIAKGHRFTTGTDTEVVLAMYQEYGSGCLQYFNGQFAFAIWDMRKKELFLARDRVGIRPLFYTNRDGKFNFASEIKAIFADPEIPRSIDTEALSQIFTFWTTITPKTAFEDIYELPPGHFMTVGESGMSEPEPYWTIPYYEPDNCWQGTFNEAKDELRELLSDAIRLRLRADVSVGAYLSGGLDSSIITSLIANNFNNNLRTFSLSFQTSAFDESVYQQEMVKYLSTDHSGIKVSNANVRDNLSKVVWQCEKPLLRTGPVPLFSLSKLVHDNNFKVVLTGEGADEIFGGYNIFKEAKLRQFWGRQPDSKWRPLLVERLYPYIFKNSSRGRMFLQKFFSVTDEDLGDPFFSHQVRWRNSSKNTNFFSAQLQSDLTNYDPYQAVVERLPSSFVDRNNFSKTQFLEMDIFLSNYLLSSQGDRVGMGNSIELRVPFLDYRLIEFAAKLPAHWKIKGLNEKYILKEAFKGVVPENIRNRPKQPYRAPIKESFLADEPGSYVQELLSEQNLNVTGYFDSKKVSFLRKKFSIDSKQVANETQNMAMVGILSTQLLHQQFIEEFRPEQIVPVVADKIVRKIQR